MRKTTKIILLCSVICCVAGPLICMIAYGLGGLNSLRVNFPKSSAPAEESDEMVTETIELEEFDNLTYDFYDYAFKMEQGDEYSISYTVAKEQVPEISQNGKSLSIKEPEINKIDSILSVGFKMNQVVLTVPRDSKVYTVDGDTSSGSAEFDSVALCGNLNLTSGVLSVNNSKSDGDINLKISSGDVEMTNCEFKMADFDMSSGEIQVNNCSFTDIVCDSLSGSYEFENVKTEKIKCTATSGDFEAEDIVANSVAIDMKSGSVGMELAGKKDDYALDLKKTSGRIRIGDDTYDDGKYNESATKNISVNVTSGDVEIDFQ